MEFTREPVVETIISPKEGYKLVIRNSKGPGHEEHFVDVIEIISFGSALFYRSLERPKSFVLPVSDYEVLEVREAKMIFKHPSQDKSSRAPQQKVISEQQSPSQEAPSKAAEAPKDEKRKERRKNTRRKRKEAPVKDQQPVDVVESENKEPQTLAPKVVSSSLNDVLKPPTTLIRDSVPLKPHEENVMQETVKAMEAIQSDEDKKLLEKTFFSSKAEPQKNKAEDITLVVEDSASRDINSEVPPTTPKVEAKPKKRTRTPRRQAVAKRLKASESDEEKNSESLPKESQNAQDFNSDQNISKENTAIKDQASSKEDKQPSINPEASDITKSLDNEPSMTIEVVHSEASADIFSKE